MEGDACEVGTEGNGAGDRQVGEDVDQDNVENIARRMGYTQLVSDSSKQVRVGVGNIGARGGGEIEDKEKDEDKYGVKVWGTGQFVN